jgi:hypothetical protein
VVSLSEKQIMTDFGVSKKDLVDNFQQGTEYALGRANFLRTTRIEVMQAFVMYMIPLCRDQVSRAHAALVASGIRLAESMGLNRDPRHLSKISVEAHVRRLVWHQLVWLDIRTTEACAPRLIIREEDFDTELPSNWTENELEGLQAPVALEDRFTDMTFVIMRMECITLHRMIWFDRPRVEKKQMSLTTILGKIEAFRKRMDQKYKHLIDPNVPIQYCIDITTRSKSVSRSDCAS